MKRKRHAFEDYEKVALLLRATDQMLLQAQHIYNRAAFADEYLRIDKRIQKLKSRTEDEFFTDYPEQANPSVFYGGEDRQLSMEYGADFINVRLAGKE